MKTKKITYYIIFLFTLFVVSCNNDDNSTTDPDEQGESMEEPEEETPDPAATLAAERQSVLDALTDTDEKVWRITQAILTNASGTIDISTNFNVTDDEIVFINRTFSGSRTDFNGTIEWRGANAIETEGTTSEETLLDLYESPFVSAFDFIDESSTELESPGFAFTYVDDTTITGTVSGSGGATIALTLAPKTNEDYVQVPNETLSFSPAFSYASNGVSGFAPGMIGSNSTNSIFVVTRESALNNGNANPERVTRFDLSTNEITEQLFFQNDFVSKQLHIIDGELKSVGGQFVNTYDLDLQATPQSAQYDPQILLSRHGSAVLNNEIYIVGGPIGGENIGNEIFQWDDLNKRITTLAIMPEIRSGARADIVNNKLYIFGGTTEFVGPDAKDTIYIYDFETGGITTETMPEALHFSYTGKYQNLIYVAGQQTTSTDDANGDGNPDGFFTAIDSEPFVGVYNTLDGEFTKLETNLNSPESETIHAMAVLDGKLFVLYGQREELAEGELQNWDIMVADID